jgi:alkaline phosphatase
MRSSEGIVILRSPGGDAGSWVQVNQAGMNGDFNNFETVVDGATLYNQALYVGVANLSSGFQVWRTGGNLQGNGPLVRWEQVGGSGLGDPNNIYTELIPFNGSLYAWTSNYVEGQQVLLASCPQAKYVVLMIGDGQGANHQQAANLYTHSTPEYQTWQENWVSTFPEGGSYDPNQAWTDFSYVLSGYTDSAAAATALFSGQKTAYGHINVSSDKLQRLFTIADKARSLGRGVGAVSTVEISNATPGAWLAHNDSRENGYAIADESLWGDPNTTGDLSDSPYYGGGHGPSLPPPDVVLGSGHPNWESGQYVNQAMRDKLAAESGQPGAFTFIERQEGSPDGGERLLDAAANSGVTRLAGLFGGSDGNLEFRLADGSGQNPENPTLAQMTLAALQVLARNPQGFVLMVEGGAIDRASHGNHMDEMLGEQIGFNEAVQTVIDWVESPNNGSSWDNTLVIVTADHETGYLTAAPGAFPNQPLGEISPQTLALEKRVADSPRRASWDDENQNGQIDAGESVYWAWNTGGHSNSLVPLFAKGVGAELFAGFATGSDPVRGAYLDNTHVFDVMDCVVGDVAPPPINPPIWVYLPVVTNP